MVEVACGRIGMHPIGACAERAAEAVAELAPVQAAVCLSPDGFVTVESVTQAIATDLVGVYQRRPGKVTQLQLWGMIGADLVCAAQERGIRGGRSQRHRVANRKAA